MQTDYQRIETAIRFIREQRESQPRLSDVAAAVNLSPSHFQRLFRRWAGVSPKQYLQFLTVEHAKRMLERDATVLDATLAAGLSSPARLHDHFVTVEAVTPGQYRAGGAGLTLRYGAASCPFGVMLVAASDRGISAASFDEADSGDEFAAALQTKLPEASLRRDDDLAREIAQGLFADADSTQQPFHLWVRGSNFQIQVWRALLAIPPGEVRTYGQIADEVGRPGASRAVGNAIGANPAAFLIPCHRVIRGDGHYGGYRWGPARKQAILAWESARLSA